MNDRGIRMRDDDGIATITLDRPSILNAWDSPMRAALLEAIGHCRDDPEIHALIVTGTGDRAFCAGQDLNESVSFDGPRAADWVGEFRSLYAAIRSIEKPVVAALNGVAAGSGFQFALLTDVRVGHPGVRMGQPEINNGIASITGPWIMKEILGFSRTVEMTPTGRMVEADEALRLGLLHHVVPPEAVMREARRIAEELAAKPPVAMQLIKRRFWDVLKPGFDEAFDAATRDHHDSYESGEPQAVSGAFLGRRRDKVAE